MQFAIAHCLIFSDERFSMLNRLRNEHKHETYKL